MEKTLNNEPEILRQVAEGNEGAYRILFEHYWPLMYSNALHFTKEAELAKDISQDIFCKIWLNREKLTAVREFRSFLYTVARNHIVDTLRKKVFSQSNHEYLVSFIENSTEIPDRKLEIKELDQLIRRAIENLPAQVQQAFILKRFEGLSHEEIADRMQISPVTSRSYITRAVNFIRLQLEGKENFTTLIILSLAAQTS